MIRWGILGAGNIAHRFAASLVNQKDSTLYAISGRNAEKLEAFKKEYPCEKVFLSYDELIEDPDIDAIYLSLPHRFHHEYALKALKNRKAVLCEKPSSLNAAQMKEIADCARENRTLFMEAMKSRFTPAYLKLKQMLEEGVIGKLEKIETRVCFTIPKEMSGMSYHTSSADGGALLDSGIYCASLIKDLLKGEPKFIRTYGNIYDGLDFYVDSFMEFDNGEAEMEVAFDRTKPRNAEIIGDKGSITLIDLHRPKTFIIHKDGKDETVEVEYDHDDFYSQIDHFVNLLKENRYESDVHTYASMIREMELLDAIKKQFTSYGEEDLKVLEQQERDLSLDGFSSQIAYEIGTVIKETALEYDLPVGIRITREMDGLAVFQYMMDAKKESNINYMEGKRASVKETGHSSAWAYVKSKADPGFAAKEGCLLSGGAFPFYVDGQLEAIVAVSGLHEGKDHELIVRSLERYLNRKTVVFPKVIG
ncbi:MAG: Gfo/Idh/MocA family oxidoreductase [Erysipelotrichaceae bacterium]|nr:Gfo/Idh/MocA family oxidoreductase [Erysipelotrichaceae bacterium]